MRISEKYYFFKPITIEEIVIFMINVENSQYKVFFLSLILRSLPQVNTDMMSNRVCLPVIISCVLLCLIEPSFGLYCINFIGENIFYF